MGFNESKTPCEACDIEIRQRMGAGYNSRILFLYTACYISCSLFWLGYFHVRVIVADIMLPWDASLMIQVCFLVAGYALGLFVLFSNPDDREWFTCACLSMLAVVGVLFCSGYLAVVWPMITCGAIAIFLVVAGVKLAMAGALSVRGSEPERITRSLRDVLILCGALGFVAYMAFAFCALPHEYSVEDIGDGMTAEEMTLSNNSENISLMFNGGFERLDCKGRLECVADLVMVEANYLGVPAPDVRAGFTQSEAVSWYSREDDTVFVNVVFLMSENGETVAGYALHEMCHCAQWRAVNGKLPEDSGFRDAVDVGGFLSDWKAEFEDYTSGEESMYDYASQDIERVARAYANVSLSEYKEQLEKGGQDVES